MGGMSCVEDAGLEGVFSSLVPIVLSATKQRSKNLLRQKTSRTVRGFKKLKKTEAFVFSTRHI